MDVKDVLAERRFLAEKMQKVPLFQSARLYCDVYCLEAGQEQKVHVHDGSDKLYFVLEGEGRFTVGAETRRVGPGRIVAAPAGSPHGVLAEVGRLSILVLTAPPPR